jgi:primosomal protein N'
VRLVSVAVPVPYLDILTYHVPVDVPHPQRGARVRVPLGKRIVTGLVVDPSAAEASQPAPEKVKAINEVLDHEPFLPESVVDLALWVAEYYACGAGDALAAAIPPTQSHKTIEVAALTAQGHDVALPTRQRGLPNSATVAFQLTCSAGSPPGDWLPFIAYASSATRSRAVPQ